VPVAVGVKLPDTADVPAPVNAITDVNDADPEHAVFPGAKTLNVTVPVGAGRPAAGGPIVAVSRNAPPNMIGVGATAVATGSVPGTTVVCDVPPAEPGWLSDATPFAKPTWSV
jgi:hypothetical protein